MKEQVKEYAIPLTLVIAIVGGVATSSFFAGELVLISKQNDEKIKLIKTDMTDRIARLEKKTDSRLKTLELNIEEDRKENQQLRIRIWDMLNELRAVVYRLEGRLSSDQNLLPRRKK